MTQATQDPAPQDPFAQALLNLLDQGDGAAITDADRLNRWDAACVALLSQPTAGPAEAILAAQVVASHAAVMECFRRAMLNDLGVSTRVRLHARAVALMRIQAATLRQLERMRAARPAAGEQIPTVLPHAR